MPGEMIPPVIINIDGDIADFVKKLAEVNGLLDKLKTKKTNVVITADILPLTKKLAEVKTMTGAAGIVAGDSFVGGFYKAVYSSPDWKMITNIARDSLGNQLMLGVGDTAGKDFMKGFYSTIYSSPDWKMINNIARDSLGNQLAIGPAGSTGNGASSSSLPSWIAALLAKRGGGGAAGAAGAGAVGGGWGAAGAGATALTTALHVSHLLLPEILGLATAVGSFTLGFLALGVASAGTLIDMASGLKNVSTAMQGMISNVPGTLAWTQSVVNLGNAWSQIPTALQPGVAAIRNLMTKMANSPMASELQQFWSGQGVILSHMFSGMGSVFQPLILATERAMVTVEGMISKMMGSGSLTHFVDALAGMVGPATVEIFQLLSAILKIGVGFMSAINNGKGMVVLVRLFQNLATAVSSPAFKAFITGWVDFDRMLSTLIGYATSFLGIIGGLGVNLGGLFTTLGFVASGFLAVKSAMFLMGKMGVQSVKEVDGVMANTKFGNFGAKLSGIATKGIGAGLMTAGIVGLVGNISTLVHTSNPLSGIFNSIGNAIGITSNKVGNSISTTKQYTKALKGMIPVTGLLSRANAAMVRSEQSIGSSLAGTQTGFANFSLITSQQLSTAAASFGRTSKAISKSYTSMIGNLNTQNTALITWGVDAQQLLKAGVNPSMIAAMMQQDPAAIGTAWQKMSSEGKAGAANTVNQMNVTWAAHLMGMGASTQQGFQNVFKTALQAINNGTPVMVQAGNATMKKIAAALHIPYTGTKANMQQIAKALQIPGASAIEAQKKIGEFSLAMLQAKTSSSAAGKSIKKAGGSIHSLKSPTASLAGTLISMATNLGMTVGGLSMLAGGFKKTGTKVVEFAKSAGSKIGTFVSNVASGFGTMIGKGATWVGEMAAQGARWVADMAVKGAKVVADFAVNGAKAVAGWASSFASMIAKGAVWVAESIAKVALVVTNNLLGADATATSWTMANTAMMLGIGAVVILVVAAVYEIIKHWKGFSGFFVGLWHTLRADAIAVWDFIVKHWQGMLTILVGVVTGPIGALVIWLAEHWTQIKNDAITAWKAIVKWISAVPGDILGFFSNAGKLLWNVGSSIISGLWGGMKSIWHKVTGWVGGLLGIIKNLKGPIAKDAVALIPHGNAIMDSLYMGLRQGFDGKVTPFLSSALGKINGTVGASPLPVYGNRSGSGGNSNVMQGGLQVHAVFQINAPGGNIPAIQAAIQHDAAQAFAEQVLVSMNAGAGRIG